MGIREVRILVQWQNNFRKLCKISFVSRDASLYLFPYAARGIYHYGSKTMPAREVSLSFDFAEDILQEQTPKLSIHEKGQVHVYVGKEKAGPLFIPPLATLTGQHIASVSPDAFESLPIFTGKVRKEGSEIDHIIPADNRAVNGRLAIYVNGYKPEFAAQDCRLTFTLNRPTIPRQLYFGIKPLGQPLIGIEDQKGVTIISGWNPLQPQEEGFDFLYIRGE